MLQTPVNYYQPQVQPQQPSYNAVKIDIHNPKVTDGCPPYGQMYPSAYNMPNNPYYTYPQTPAMPYYPAPNGYVAQKPVQMPTQPIQIPQQQACTCTCPQHATQPQSQPTPAPSVQPTVAPTVQPTVVPVPVVPAPVPQVPVQQVINNGVPTQQTIQQGPAVQTEQPVQQKIVTPENSTTQTVNPAQTVTPETKLNQADITPVLKGLQSNNMAEQSDALSKIGEVAEKPEEVKKYLETSVLDALLNIINADTKGLEPATKEQIEARTKLMNGQTLTDAEKNAAMTLAPQELADRNKQHALYSLAILQKALANEIEAKTGEKLSIDKLPAIDQVVNTVKSNPNPLLRASALVALAHLNKPEYKPVLTEIFQLAQNDEDPNVKQVAQEALNKLNGVEQPKQA